MKLQNKIAVITGGSRGIGFATAEKFLQEGASVVIAASSPASAETAVQKLRARYPAAHISGISPVLSNPDSVRAAFAGVVSSFGAIDILVNNAGMTDSTPFLSYTPALFEKVTDLNVRGVFNASHAAAEQMEKHGQGVILSTSSLVTIVGQAVGVAYPMSKFAVNGMTLSLARELGPKGIRVNAVAPGIIQTDMLRSVPPEVIEPMAGRIPLRRLGQPEDVANAFAFLASEEAAYITGVILSVDGLART